ncbi:hypothetical protein ZEAMMB73_Zm00001d024005 [Zea mays]|uniref:Uncharacterized protein n=1 Tax=Zea mays TaxID=4577 RepID=A0A1D6IX96_MAIZE|nr:hypothetical protein ZEAMMB73_Zm00001d024005 [Zea mays]
MAAPASLLLSLFCSDPCLWSFIPLPASSAGAQASSSSFRGAPDSCSPSFFQPRRRLAARPSARHFVPGHQGIIYKLVALRFLLRMCGLEKEEPTLERLEQLVDIGCQWVILGHSERNILLVKMMR